MIKNIVIAILAAPWALFLYKLSRGQVTFTRERARVGADPHDEAILNWPMAEELSRILNRERAD